MIKKLLIRLRSGILVFLTHQIALPVLKIFREPNEFTWSPEQLKNLPLGSFGNDLYLFLAKRNLSLLKHYTRHDLKHVLLNYDTTDEGEACLQSFMLGNGRISFPVVANVLYGFSTMTDYWNKMRSAFQLGRQSTPVHGWPWNELLEEQTIVLRNKVF